MYDLDQFGGVRVEIHHIARLFRRLGTGVHRDRHVGLRQRRGVVGTVAGHRHQPTFRLILADQRQLGLRRRFGEKVVHSGFRGDSGGGQSVIAGDHHRFNPHFTQLGKTLFDAAFHDIFQRDNPQHPLAFGDHQRRRAKTRHFFNLLIDIGRKVAAVGLNVAADGIYGTFADHPLVDVDAAHPGLGGKRHKGGMQRLEIALAQVKALFGQHHDAAAFRRFIGQR